MPYRKPIPIFLSSPSDVMEERRRALDVIDRLNDDPFFRERVVLKSIAWDKKGAGVALEATLTPQDAINMGMRRASACAIVVVIFWSRMGTPLKPIPPDFVKPDGSPYLSGTEWEYEDAVRGHHESTTDPKLPRVLVYRRIEKPEVATDDLQADEKRIQYQRVEDFFNRFTDPDGAFTGGYNLYPTPDAFEGLLEQHLRNWVARLIDNYDPFALDEAQRRAQQQRAVQQAKAEAERRQQSLTNARYTKWINSLPQQDMAERFRDRVKQRDAIVNALKAGALLVSVYGQGGIGKTALACKVLGDLQRDREDSALDGMVYLGAGSQSSTGISLERVFLDFLKLLTGAAKVAVDAAWRDPQMSVPQKIGVLLDNLSAGRYVLLLDNLETLQDPATHKLADPDLKAFFESLFERGGGLRVLATSREQINLSGMRRVKETRVSLVDGLPVDDAIQLLRELDDDGEAGPKDADAASLTVIAEKTGGFPRALEAVVALLKTPRMTLDKLLSDPALLTGEVRALIEEAIRRLDPDSLRVMETLAVYGRPLSESGLEYLLAPHLDITTLPGILDRLVAGYFVSFNKATGLYALHPIDQDFCRARVPEGSTDSEEAYTHRELLVRAADYHRQQRSPKDTWNEIEDLEPQLLEFEYRVEVGNYDAAAEVLTEIDLNYLLRWGYFARLIAMHERLVGRVQRLDLAQNSIRILGIAYCLVGRPRDGIHCFEQALSIAREIGDRYSEGRNLGNLGNAYWSLGQMQTAIDHYQQALAIAHDTGERGKEGMWLSNLGNVYYALGQVQVAIDHYQQAVAIAREIGDPSGEGNYLGNLGEAKSRLGQHAEAIANVKAGLAIAEEMNELRLRSSKGGQLASALLFAGDLPAARAAAITAQAFDAPENNHIVAALRGLLHARLNERDAALDAFADAERFSDALLDKTPGFYEALYARGLARAGQSLLAAASLDPAISDYGAARAICDAAGVVDSQLRLLDALMQCPGGDRLVAARAALVGEA